MSYSFLKPVRIGNMVLKNRVIVPAMARYLCKDGYVTDAYVEYLRAIAEGGVAMVTVGIMPIDLNWPSTMPTQPCLGDDKYIPGLTRAVAAIHAGGAKASLQPWMPGRAPYTYANAVERAQDIAIVNRLTVDEIHNIQKKYAAAALRCAMAGADVVEWHNAHNYLGEQFFSPYFNRRTDEYGQQSDLPAVAVACNNGVRHEGVQTHAGRERERQVCHKRHAQRAQAGCQGGCQQYRGGIHAGGAEYARVYGKDVRHGHKGSDTGHDLGLDCGFVFR